MELTVGAVLEGKVKSITNFGAFIALPENKTGLVHISEVANAYVSDIRQHLTEGQDVKVVVIGTENGKSTCPSSVWSPSPSVKIPAGPISAATAAAAATAHPAGRAAISRIRAVPVPPLCSPQPPRLPTSSSRRS
ncbi:MAG: S1 RNA-binding domain-containing protein [Oscillospiraceae bacterium]|nr:S1 RNA-binding domain-containing protein [Oscillospiraceae bacterium]